MNARNASRGTPPMRTGTLSCMWRKVSD